MILAVWSAWLFRRHRTPLRPFLPPSALITTGPYRLSRNPVYLAMLILLAAGALALGSLSPWLGPPLFTWLITRRFIVKEEAILEDRFGAAYRDYRTRVRRWL